MEESWLREFEVDWYLAGKSKRTVVEYVRYLKNLNSYYKNPTLADVKEWLLQAPGAPTRRKMALAVRAFGRWCQEAEVDAYKWWSQVPVAIEPVLPQQTVTEEDYLLSLTKCTSNRDRALVEILWATGLRRGEIERLKIEDLDFAIGCLVVRLSKSGRSRVVPISRVALRSIRRLVGRREHGFVLGMSGNAIRLRLRTLDIPPSHAWRRGWAVHALANGVSESSLKAAAGWSGGAMVSRYTHALAPRLARTEFGRAWGESRTQA